MQNIAHLYVGCEVKCSHPFHPEKNSINSDGKPILSASLLADFHEGVFSINDFKLCLRRPSSITEQEAVELFDLIEDSPSTKPESKSWYIMRCYIGRASSPPTYNWPPKALVYLLSKGIWLFGDEAFEAGLIIEKK